MREADRNRRCGRCERKLKRMLLLRSEHKKKRRKYVKAGQRWTGIVKCAHCSFNLDLNDEQDYIIRALRHQSYGRDLEWR